MLSLQGTPCCPFQPLQPGQAWAAHHAGRTFPMENCLAETKTKQKKKSEPTSPTPVPSAAFTQRCKLIVINNMGFFLLCILFPISVAALPLASFPRTPVSPAPAQARLSSRHRAKRHPSSLMGGGQMMGFFLFMEKHLALTPFYFWWTSLEVTIFNRPFSFLTYTSTGTYMRD